MRVPAGEDPSELTETTPLITGGILDSFATMKLVMFLEERSAFDDAGRTRPIPNISTRSR